jgi:peptide/nickel transport system substrate-binding protein
VSRDQDSVESLIGQYMDRRIDRRAFFKRAGALGISLGAAGTLLAACGGGEETAAPPPPAETGGETEPAATTAPPETTTEAAPTPGGILREGYDRDISRPDPVNTFWNDASLWPALHETVVTQTPDGEFIPVLAESWDTSEDGLTWTFKIRDGLQFQSGDPCDAAAVTEAMKAFADPAQGVNAGFWAPVKSITAEEGNIVQVTMAHPYADFPFVLNNGYSAIFNKRVRDELAEQYGVKGTDGTGPFTLDEFVPGSHASVVRWEAYQGAPVPLFENEGKPYLDGIRWIVLLEPATRAQELEAGNVDALKGPAPQDVDRLKGNSDLAVIELQEPALYLLGLNFKEKALGFDDVQVRQAFMHAIDRQAIADSVFFGKAAPAYTIAHSAWKYYEPNVEQYGTFDPELSKSLFDQAGWVEGQGGVREKNGNKLSFEIVSEGNDKAELLIAQAVQEMLKDVGIDLTFKPYGADYFEKFLASPKGYTFKIAWVQILDASLLFTGSKYYAPACCNASFVNVPELDQAFDEWQSASNDDELAAAASKAQLVAAEQAAVIPIVTPLIDWVHHKRVHGWLPTQPNYYTYYNDVWIEAG